MSWVKYLVCVVGIFAMVLTSAPLDSGADYRAFVPPPKELVHFTFGFNGAISSALWLRLLKDVDICDQDDGEKTINKGAKLDDILTYELKESRCSTGWTYNMIDRITDLSPRFLYGYSHGGIILSVLVDDREGAKNIFDKGLKVYPDNYSLTYSAAYHYLFEMQDPKRAAELLIKSYELGGPEWMVSLAANLYSKANQREVGVFLLQDFISKNPNSPMMEKVKERLETLQNED